MIHSFQTIEKFPKPQQPKLWKRWVVSMLAGYPARLAGLAQMAGTFTTIKWALVGLCAALIVAGAALAAARRLKRGMP